jgi:hypothetical protein
VRCLGVFLCFEHILGSANAALGSEVSFSVKEFFYEIMKARDVSEIIMEAVYCEIHHCSEVADILREVSWRSGSKLAIGIYYALH